MKESSFQFANPSLSYLTFKENADFLKKDKVNLGIKIDVKRDDISDYEAAVSIRVTIGGEDTTSPFCIETEFMAEFKWDKDMKKDTVEIFLSQNAPAMLVSYARPIISMITNSSHFPAYNLPFINFVDNNK